MLFNKYRHYLRGEALEQALLVLWLEQNNYTFTSVPNSTYTKSWKQKIVNKLTGLRPGMSDMIIILKRGSILFLELKKPGDILKSGKVGKSKSKVSQNQIAWQNKINKVQNCEYKICYGHKECIDSIQELERELKT